MKNYIVSMMAVVAIALTFSACENDEIEIVSAASVTVTVNPSGVVSAFSDYEYSSNDLAAIDSDERLRVRLLVYDASGNLVDQETAYMTSYANSKSWELSLNAGSVYTFVTITDLVEYTNNAVSFEYWELAGEDKLSETTITDAGYIGYTGKILGFASRQMSVAAGTSINLSAEPAGGLLLFVISNIHAWSDVVDYYLLGNATMNNLQLSSSGSYTANVDLSDSYNWIYVSFEPDNYTGSLIYGYNFMFPMSNLGMQFRAYTDEYYYDFGTVSFSVVAGQGYVLYADASAMTLEVESSLSSLIAAPQPDTSVFSFQSAQSARKNNNVRRVTELMK